MMCHGHTPTHGHLLLSTLATRSLGRFDQLLPLARATDSESNRDQSETATTSGTAESKARRRRAPALPAGLRLFLQRALVCFILATSIADTVTDVLTALNYYRGGDKDWAGILFGLLGLGYIMGFVIAVILAGSQYGSRNPRVALAAFASLLGLSEVPSALGFIKDMGDGSPQASYWWIIVKAVRRLFEGLPLLVVQAYVLLVNQYRATTSGRLKGSHLAIALASIGFSLASTAQGGSKALGIFFNSHSARAFYVAGADPVRRKWYVVASLLRFVMLTLDVAVHVALLATVAAVAHLWVLALVLPHMGLGVGVFLLFILRHGRSRATDAVVAVILSPFASLGALRFVEDVTLWRHPWRPAIALLFVVANSVVVPGLAGHYLLQPGNPVGAWLGHGHCDVASSVLCGVCTADLRSNCLSHSFVRVVRGTLYAFVGAMVAYFVVVMRLCVTGTRGTQ